MRTGPDLVLSHLQCSAREPRRTGPHRPADGARGGDLVRFVVSRPGALRPCATIIIRVGGPRVKTLFEISLGSATADR